jgi:glycosyltransferase involved in cell wall biosynthesis
MAIDYSLIIPAYNEEQWLPSTLKVVQQAMGQQSLSGEVIVVDNNSSDSTAEVATAAGVQLVHEPRNPISRARNAGASVAQGRYLVFLDADTHISAALLARALDNLQAGECCGGGATVAFDQLPSAASRYGLSLWNGLSRKMRLAAGCFVYCRRDAFAAVGGFSEAVYASEEIWLSRRIRRWGRARGQEFCIIVEYPAVSSGRKMEWFGPLQQAALLLMVIVFPFFVRFKALCGFWYKRPE